MNDQSWRAALRRRLPEFGKRPRTVVKHILEHGHITTEQLKTTYGYNHPPRATRDVRELGIPLETFRVRGSDGRMIAAYRFGRQDHLPRLAAGRTAVAASLKRKLADEHGARCAIYLEPFPEAELQVDHRIPFEIAGESAEREGLDAFMLLCPSANRAKSWSCENCPNWTRKDAGVCASCYWAFPESCTHGATQQVRRVDLLWRGREITDWERLRDSASRAGLELPEHVKRILRRVLGKHRSG